MTNEQNQIANDLQRHEGGTWAWACASAARIIAARAAGSCRCGCEAPGSMTRKVDAVGRGGDTRHTVAACYPVDGNGVSLVCG